MPASASIQVDALSRVANEARAARKRTRAETAIVAAVFIASFAIGELILRITETPEWIVPAPSVIGEAWVDGFGDVIAPNAAMTLVEVAIGFLLGATIGITLGAFVAQYPFLDKLLSPYILILITTPIVALVPLLMLWLGYGITTKIVAVAIASFPPVMLNTVTGINQTPQLQLDLMQFLGASKWDTFRKVRIHNALPSIFTGLTIGAIFGLITAVSAEFVGGSKGLGNRLIYFASTLETPLVFAIIFTLAAIGIVIYLSITLVRQRLTKWVS
jgi:NitT/TauT family transport system permease protein